MKRLLTTLTALILTFTMFSQSDIGTLTLKIENIKSFDSKLYVGVYNSQEDFKNKSNSIDSTILVPKTESVTIKMKLPRNNYYAAAGFQDLNHNGKLDTGVFGIPVEPVCVSDYDHKPKAPPTFKKSEFFFKNDTTIVMPLMSGNKEVEEIEKEL
jgi:uncharacterized protein (DUF2141 family)